MTGAKGARPLTGDGGHRKKTKDKGELVHGNDWWVQESNQIKNELTHEGKKKLK